MGEAPRRCRRNRRSGDASALRTPGKAPASSGDEASDEAHGARRAWQAFRDLSPAIQVLCAILAIVLPYTPIAKLAGLPPFPGPPDVRVDVAQSHLDALGYDDPTDEYVCLVNAEDDAVDLTGWELRDAKRVVNVLPRYELPGHGQVRVHPGPGRDTRADLYGDAGRAAWNNDGGTITLVDDGGDEIAQEGYPAQDDEGAEHPTCGPGRAP